jgi:hypothetical protein
MAQINMFHNIVLKLKVNKQQTEQVEVGLDQGVDAIDASPLSSYRYSTRLCCG